MPCLVCGENNFVKCMKKRNFTVKLSIYLYDNVFDTMVGVDVVAVVGVDEGVIIRNVIADKKNFISFIETIVVGSNIPGNETVKKNYCNNCN